MKVLKFGGTSVGTVDSIKAVFDILENGCKNGEKQIVVLSAMGGVTNLLTEMAEQAVRQEDFSEALEALENKHFEVVRALLPVTRQNAVILQLKLFLQELEDTLRGIQQIRQLNTQSRDLIMSFGEQCSAFLLSQMVFRFCEHARYVDARQFIRTDSHFGHAHVKQGITEQLIQQYFQDRDNELCFVTGFIATDDQGCTTTLGRGGSDYSAALIASALSASAIEIWTDVDGMLTADPRLVKDSFSLSELSYTEAMELSYFGAKVIYPPTMVPAFRKRIPIFIRNTFHPNFPGTKIQHETEHFPYPIRGISSIDKISLIHLTGSGMVGKTGFSGRLFSLLSQEQINIVMITQGSSEHSITLALHPDDAAKAQQSIISAFELEINAQKLQMPEVESGLSVLAIVGENMKKTPGMAGKLFHALGTQGVNVRVIAQGSSEYNISVVINKSDLSKSLNAVHDSFFAKTNRIIPLFMLGTGNIGSTFIKQVAQQQAYLREERGVALSFFGLGNSRQMLFDSAGIAFEKYDQFLTEKGSKGVLEEFIDQMIAMRLPGSIFIDNTASSDVSNAYHAILEAGISIVASNKIANSGWYKDYSDLQQKALEKGCFFRYETNVGAGLPIVEVLKNLVLTGDKIVRLQAVLSGTISYIFNHFTGDAKFHEVVRQAQQLGYTEPDPRDDLNGTDFMRKMLILSREAGFSLELDDAQVEPLLPARCLEAEDVDAFYQTLEESEEYFENLKQKAESGGKVLRYIGEFSEGKIVIKLEMVDHTHPFYSLSGSDNIISMTTKRYGETPLVVKGPGAGAEVTAAGVFADVLAIGAKI